MPSTKDRVTTLELLVERLTTKVTECLESIENLENDLLYLVEEVEDLQENIGSDIDLGMSGQEDCIGFEDELD